jgi:hypothetical protein
LSLKTKYISNQQATLKNTASRRIMNKSSEIFVRLKHKPCVEDAVLADPRVVVDRIVQALFRAADIGTPPLAKFVLVDLRQGDTADFDRPSTQKTLGRCGRHHGADLGLT